MRSSNGIWGDPMVHFDSKGNLYYSHLGKNPDKFFPNWIDKMVVQRISINYDTCFSDKAIGFNSGKIQDKEWISTNSSGDIYLTWTEFDKYQSRNVNDHSRIRFSRSTDFGNSWTEPVVVSDKEGDCLDGDSTMEGATSCTDSKGNIFVCWSGINKIWFDRSTDNAASFGRDKIITQQIGGWDIPVKHIYRANGMPFILCNNSNSNHKDRIYLNWTDTRNGDADVFMKYSDDAGETWSRDIRVNDDKTGNGAEQFSNNFCIDPSNGNVYVVFYDRRNSSSGAFIDVYIACSKDGGEHWENIRVTPKPFPAPGKSEFFGDYIDIDAVNGNVITVFTRNEKNKFDVYSCHLDPVVPTNYHVPEDIQAVILNDTVYVHWIHPKNKKYKLSISTFNNSTIFKSKGLEEEIDLSVSAKGNTDAKITVKHGFKKKTITVLKKYQKPS